MEEMDSLILSGEGKDERGFKLSESKITPFNLPRPVGVLRGFCSTWDLEGEI